MKKNKMIVAVIFTFALLTAVFAMSGGGNNDPAKEAQQVKQDTQSVQAKQSDQAKLGETVKDILGFDTGLTKDQYDLLKKEYYEKAKELKLLHIDPLFFNKVDLNKKNEFDNFNIHLGASLDECNLNDFIIRSELIIIGTFDSVIIDNDTKSTFPVTFKVRVNEIIANETGYNTIPTFITLKYNNFSNIPFDKLKSNKESLVKGKEQYVLFLTRRSFYYYVDSHEKGRTKTYVTNDCFEPYTFTSLAFSDRKIEKNKIAKDYSKSDLDENYWLDLNVFKKNVKEIIEINDKNNFFKRSYK